MGARFYNPATGWFTGPDPVEGGSPSLYSYPTDPVNDLDLDGKRWWRKNSLTNWLGATVRLTYDVASWVPGGKLLKARKYWRYAKKIRHPRKVWRRLKGGCNSWGKAAGCGGRFIGIYDTYHGARNWWSSTKRLARRSWHYSRAGGRYMRRSWRRGTRDWRGVWRRGTIWRY